MLENLAQFVTYLVCVLIFLISLLALRSRREAGHNRRSAGELTKFAPALTVMLGILGACTGAYSGLSQLNNIAVAASAPQLFAGLKTVFVPLTLGVLAHLSLTCYYKYCDGKYSKKGAVASDDPIALLQNIATELDSLILTTKSTGMAVAQCITSNEETSLIAQIKLLRGDLGAMRTEVKEELNQFGDRVVDVVTESMITALRDIVDQFHRRLNDLVGAEFRQLKDSMLKLVEWQDNYRIAVDAMQAQLKTCMQQVSGATGALAATNDATRTAGEQLALIKDSLHGISGGAADIALHIESLKLQNAQLTALLQGIKTLGEEAKTVMPTFTQHLNAATRHLADSAGATEQQLTQASIVLRRSMDDAITTLNRSAEAHCHQADTYMQQLENNLQDTLTSALDVIVVKLASLSNRFVEDYTPLTERLREIVHLADGIDVVKKA